MTRRRPRSRFYDGRLYARILDPLLRGLRGYVTEQIEPERRVLDVGCGTGALAFDLARRAKEVVGVELSPAMVEHGKRRLAREAPGNLSFLVGDAAEVLADRPDGDFDVATMVMVLHEMPTAARVPVLREAARVAEHVLCVDFRVPMPKNVAGLRNRFFEIAAGREHYRAFRDFNRQGGTPGIVEQAGLVGQHVRHIDAATLDVWRVERPPARAPAATR